MMNHGHFQDLFLSQVRREQIPVTMFLMNGYQMRGIITAYDDSVVILEGEYAQQVVFKHAISTITPSQIVNLKKDP